ncbi:MAG: membrane protein insertase YidC, partial [Alkalispirochaeta sp.]
MEKNTLLAVVLSVMVITGGFVIQNMLYPPEPLPETTADTTADTSGNAADSAEPSGESTTSEQSTSQTAQSQQVVGNPVQAVPVDGLSDDPVIYENELLRVVFDPAGGRIVSYQLLDHVDDGEPVEMVMQGDTDIGAFELRFGDADAPAVRDLFRVVDTTDENTIIFERDFYVEGASDQPFTARRTYRFYPGEYVLETSVEFQNSVNAVVPLNFDGDAYTISYGPQIGPSYEELDNRQEYRNFYYYDGNRRRNIRIRNQGTETLEEQVQWTALAGKYFAVVAIPGALDYTYTM